MTEGKSHNEKPHMSNLQTQNDVDKTTFINDQKHVSLRHKRENGKSSMFSDFCGIKHFLSTFRFAYDGFIACFKSEVAFRQELAIFILNTLAVVFLPLDFSIRLLMATLGVAILCVELINTALEAVVDLVSPEYHLLAKKAKDVCSAAVFLTITFFLTAWTIIIIRILCKGHL